MLNHQLQTEAVKAAKSGNWEEAAKLNQAIIEENPNDAAAFNRLGIAWLQLKKHSRAKKAFNQALKIDPKNNIAKKNLAKLKNNQAVTPHIDLSQIFVEEPGKTKIIKLHRLAGKEVLETLSTGDLCHLKVKKRYISVEVNNQYVGALPEDISFRLTKLMNTGNQYDCYIQSTDHNLCQVYIKETKRSKRNKNIHSFPISGNLAKANLEIKEEYQEKVPFEVIDLEQEDETKAPEVNATSTVIT